MSAQRKSSRARKRTSYLEDDFNYDYEADIDLIGVASKRTKSKILNSPPKRIDDVVSPKIETLEGVVKAESIQTSDSQSPQINARSGGHSCEVCHKVCVDLAAFKRHMKSHSSDRKFKCEVCHKAFIDSCSLKRHVRIHGDERPYTCDLCFKSFRDAASLTRHQQTHSERPRVYTCQTCNKSFADKHGLTRHERTHTGLRPFECPVCHKTFSESGSFKRHEKIHIGIRKFACIVCGKRFLEKQSLLRHQRIVCGVEEDTTMTLSEAPVQFAPEDQSETIEVLKASEILDTKVNGTKERADEPSLQSLMKKDPSLCAGISDLVESIDSYEQMLNLCGDDGHQQIEAALACEPHPMPEDLICFECGEHLVDGENFESKGKTFSPLLKNQFRCITCEEESPADNKAKFAHTGDQSEAKKIPDGSNDDKCMQHGPETSNNSLKFKQNEDVNISNRDTALIAASRDSGSESMENFGAQNGAYLFNKMYPHLLPSYAQEDGTSTSTNASVSRSNSTDESEFHDLEPKVTFGVDVSIDVQTSNSERKVDQLPFDSQPTSLDKSEAPAAQMEYMTEDGTIPSVFPCHLCPKVFATPDFLSRHLELHRMSPHKCMVCSKTFTSGVSLRRHMTTHTGEKPYTCPVCTKKFRDPSNFCKHKKICTGPPDATPTQKKKSYKSSTPKFIDSGTNDTSRQESLYLESAFVDQAAKQALPPPSSPSPPSVIPPIHFSYDINENDDEEEDADLQVSFGQPPPQEDEETLDAKPETFFYDDVSGMTEPTPNKTDYDEMYVSRYELGDGPQASGVSCEICGRSFPTDKDLERHMRFHSAENPDLTCEECGKSFSDRNNLKRHVRIHAETRPHICEICQRGYCDNWSLKKHQSRGCVVTDVRVSLDMVVPCPQCNRVFGSVDLQLEHIASVHKGALKFECDICHKMFSESYNLKRHRRLHMAVCIACDKEFKDVKSLEEHQRVECPGMAQYKPTGVDNTFPCPECGREYTSKANLERHKKFHLSLKPHVCSVCNKGFSEALKLKRHMKTHAQSQTFSCGNCHKSFSYMQGLKQHLLKTKCLTKNPNPPVIGKTDVPSLDSDSKVSVPERASMALPQLPYSLPHLPSTFPCELCGKVFQKRFLLVRHMNVHSEARRFTCEQCQKSYKDTSSLKRHMLVHKGVKSCVCPDCGKSFFYPDSLRRHRNGQCGKHPLFDNLDTSNEVDETKVVTDSVNTNNEVETKHGHVSDSLNNNEVDDRVENTKEETSMELALWQPLEEENDVVSKNVSASIPSRLESKHKPLSWKLNFKLRKASVTGNWSCLMNGHCWRCNRQFSSEAQLLDHAWLHRHKKPYISHGSFCRWSRKVYIRSSVQKGIEKSLHFDL